MALPNTSERPRKWLLILRLILKRPTGIPYSSLKHLAILLLPRVCRNLPEMLDCPEKVSTERFLVGVARSSIPSLESSVRLE